MLKDVVNGANISNLNRFSNNLDSAINDAKKDILEQAKRYKNNSLASQNGFVAESVHVGSFNIDSAIKRSPLKAVREKNGNHGDYKIIKNGKTVAEGEIKHYNNAEQTENAMRGYKDKQLVGPKDQIKKIKKIARRKELKNKTTRPKVSKEHRNVKNNADDAIKKDGVTSKPKTLKQTKEITKKANKGKVDTTDLMPDLLDGVKNSAISGAIDGAKCGAIFGGGVSAVSNICDVFNNKKDCKEALVETTKDLTISVVDSAVKNAAGSAAKTGSIYMAEKASSEVTKRVLGSAAPVIVATTAVEVCKDLYKCANGEIDGEEVAYNTIKNTATSAGAWAGAEAGAALGAFGGPVGAVVGGIAGGILGAVGISSLFD